MHETETRKAVAAAVAAEHERVVAIIRAGVTKCPAVVLAMLACPGMTCATAVAVFDTLPDARLHPALVPMVKALEPATDPDVRR